MPVYAFPRLNSPQQSTITYRRGIHMSYAVQFTPESRNQKTGPIPVSTSSRNTCPNACPLKANGCYAEAGPLGMMWAALSKATPGQSYPLPRGAHARAHDWQSFTAAIAALPAETLWRHNQAGDLPGENNAIDTKALKALVDANRGRRGFTYTHKPLSKSNASAINRANKAGFTVNLSADNLTEADKLADAQVGPVVVVLPEDVQGNRRDIATPKGRKVVVCPATYRDDVSCFSCQLCQRQKRKVVVGFPAHGASRRKANAIALSK